MPTLASYEGVTCFPRLKKTFLLSLIFLYLELNSDCLIVLTPWQGALEFLITTELMPYTLGFRCQNKITVGPPVTRSTVT